ncbi:MAG: hypothetical protein OJF52_002940 [Nitrospira sp.]|jgi:hypothetical protein|nr:MAG: hypothetical protein OJF52_002940 [Nitrospira sp.]
MPSFMQGYAPHAYHGSGIWSMDEACKAASSPPRSRTKD